MHKYGDKALYQIGAPEKTVNALVVQSNPQPDGEHLTLVYLDPAVGSASMSGMLVDKAIARAFATPLVEGKAYGWKDLPDAYAELNAQVSQLTSDNSGLRAIVEKLRAENTSLIEAEAPKSPSDEMLDHLMPHLTDLSMTVAKIAPHMEISPDGTLISAKTLLESMSMQVPAPIQPKDPAMVADVEEAKKEAEEAGV